MTLLAALTALAVTASANNAHAEEPTLAAFSGFTQVAARRVGRTMIDYEYRLVATGGASNSDELVVTVTSSSAATVVVDGEARFGPVTAGRSALSLDTITLRQNRRFPFDPADLDFTLTDTPALPGPVLGTTTDNPASQAVIGADGGSLAVVDDNGTGITLDVPELGVFDDTTFSATPLDTVSGLPSGIEVLSAARFGPSGTGFLLEPTLTFLPGSAPSGNGPLFGFYANDDGTGFLLRPLIDFSTVDPLAGAIGLEAPRFTLPHFTVGGVGQAEAGAELPGPPVDATLEERFLHIATEALTEIARRQIAGDGSADIADVRTPEFEAALDNWIGDTIETTDGNVVRTGLTADYFDLLLAPELDRTRFPEYVNVLRSVLRILALLQVLATTDELPELEETIADADELTDLTLAYRAGLLLSCWKEPPSASNELTRLFLSTAAILQFIEATDTGIDPTLDCFDAGFVSTYIPERARSSIVGSAFNQFLRGCTLFGQPIPDLELGRQTVLLDADSVVVTGRAPLTIDITLGEGSTLLALLGFETLTLTFDAPDGEKSTGTVSAVAAPNALNTGGTLTGTVTATPTRLDIDVSYDVQSNPGDQCSSRDGDITFSRDYVPLDFSLLLQSTGVFPTF